jgi:site-specific DNA-methyltransferase (adenine-specific)
MVVNNIANIDVHFSSKSNEYETPQDFYNNLNEEFHFTLDPCCTSKNRKCDKYYTIEENGLIQDWSGEIVFVNPPYGSELKKWVKKCHDEALKGALVVMLSPARTDTSYFHNYIYKYFNRKDLELETEIRFIKGRLKFINKTLPSYREDGNFEISSAPFPSMVVIFKSNKKET